MIDEILRRGSRLCQEYYGHGDSGLVNVHVTYIDCTVQMMENKARHL